MRRSISAGLALLALVGALVPAAARAQGMGGGGMGGMGGMGAPPSGQQRQTSGDILPEVDEKLANDPQKVFEHAEKAYQERDWLEAIAYYQHLRQKFSFNVPLVTVADLRLADIAFAREKWAEARGYYRTFLRFHPRSDQADFAAFRIGLCDYNEIPGDSFLQPPADEKDQSEVKAALQQMRDFVRSYPQSKYLKEAQDVVVKCEDKLAAHEMYVAEFYARREKWKGVVLRAEGLAKNFPESRLAPKAMLLAIKAHMKLGQGAEAKAVYDALVQRKPDPDVLSKAQDELKKGG